MEDQKKYGLVGKSLAHSFSQKYFRQKFKDQSINADYLNYEIHDISQVDHILKADLVYGLNVTIPYKESIIHFLDATVGDAQKIGAVNTVQFVNGKTIGHNTDTYGFRQMIKPFFKSHHEKAMILGTGGASKAVKYVLEQLGCEVILISREPKGDNQFHYADINDLMLDAYKMVINTTPVGMLPLEEYHVPFPFEYLTTKHLVVDLIYNPAKTLFLEKAEEAGATILNGETMLIQQAEKAWEIWNE